MEAILKLKTFSPKTEKVYLSIVKRLEKLNFKFPGKKAEKVDYIKEFFLENKMEKASTRLDLLNLVIVLRTIQELSTEKLKEYRAELSKERLTSQVNKMQSVKETLMSLADFNAELMRAYEAGEYKKFIVNYLMSHYGVRNMDVDINIVKSKSGMTPTQNYLLLGKDKVTWIRNQYKTMKTFGIQQHEITDPEFVSASKKQGIGRLFAEGQLSNGIRKLLINGMGEAKIFKMVIDDSYDKKDTKRINELSKSRGTSIATIKSFYDVNATDEIIRQL